MPHQRKQVQVGKLLAWQDRDLELKLFAGTIPAAVEKAISYAAAFREGKHARIKFTGQQSSQRPSVGEASGVEAGQNLFQRRLT